MPAKKKKKSIKKHSKSKHPKSKKTLKKKAAAKKSKKTKRAAGKAARKGKPGLAASVSRASSARSGGQSGDLQGLSRREGADSESVEELLEEGNPFEAGVVSGVEAADLADEKEVHTHEVPEDDVPDEYLDRDS